MADELVSMIERAGCAQAAGLVESPAPVSVSSDAEEAESLAGSDCSVDLLAGDVLLDEVVVDCQPMRIWGDASDSGPVKPAVISAYALGVLVEREMHEEAQAAHFAWDLQRGWTLGGQVMVPHSAADAEASLLQWQKRGLSVSMKRSWQQQFCWWGSCDEIRAPP